MTAVERNAKVAALMATLFEQASRADYEPDERWKDSLEELFSTTVWGFREILLVIVIARLLNGEYEASKAFYSCKPRAIYEGPIRNELRERRIPHRRSGPLNVAKAAIGINSQWATQRSPKKIADLVVRIVGEIESMPKRELEVFAIALHGRFLAESERAADIKLEVSPEVDPEFLHLLCSRLINEEPDGGNTPEHIVELAMRAYHEELRTGVEVVGHGGRASVSSVSGKNLGDIVERRANGTIIHVHEVTVKAFGEERVRDSYEAVKAFDLKEGAKASEIMVLCRKQNAHPNAGASVESSGYLGKLAHRNLTYHFIEIHAWILSQLLRMPPTARTSFYGKLADYIGDFNTSERVKQLWNKLHDE